MEAPEDRPMVTFDVFDTVITRAIGEPRSVGYVLAERLRAAGVVDVPPEVFVEAHQRAEHLAYLRHGERRSTAEACVQLAELLGLAPAAAARLEELEIAVELELTRGVPAQIAKVRAARAAGAQVGFLSDTPLRHSAVEAMLRRTGAMEDGDLLWVSNELAAEKGTGRAYAAVVRDVGRAPSSWRHTGDNRRSDVRMARWSGVSATWSSTASLNSYERLLEAASPVTGGLSSLLAGASRRSRLVLRAGQGPVDPQLPAVTGVVAPLLAALALRAAAAAEGAGCDRLLVSGAGARDLLAVAAPVLSVLHPGLRLELHQAAPVGERWALVSTDVLAGPAQTGPELALHLGVAREASGSATGWAFDDRAGTGVTGTSAEAVRGVGSLLPCGHAGLAQFGAELATVIALLPVRADLRSAVQPGIDAFWLRPTADEVSAWTRAAPGPAASWPAARHAGAAGLVRVAGLARERGRPLLRKLQRARLLADARREVKRR